MCVVVGVVAAYCVLGVGWWRPRWRGVVLFGHAGWMRVVGLEVSGFSLLVISAGRVVESDVSGFSLLGVVSRGDSRESQM